MADAKRKKCLPIEPYVPLQYIDVGLHIYLHIFMQYEML